MEPNLPTLDPTLYRWKLIEENKVLVPVGIPDGVPSTPSQVLHLVYLVHQRGILVFQAMQFVVEMLRYAAANMQSLLLVYQIKIVNVFPFSIDMHI